MESTRPTASRATFAWTAALTILLAVFAFITILTNSKSETIRSNVQILQLENDNYRKIDTCIAILYSAENNSRFFVVTRDSSYLRSYVRQLQAVNRILEEYHKASDRREKSLSRLISRKQLKDREFSNLRMMVDSLLSFSLNETQKAARAVRSAEKLKVQRQTEEVDSIQVSTSKKGKRKLVKRLMDAIRDKDAVDSSILKTHHETVVKEDSLQILVERPIVKPHSSFEKARRELNEAERDMLAINSLIFLNLQNTLQNLRSQEQRDIKTIRDSLLAATKAKSEEMSLLIWASVALVLLLSAMIVINLLKLYKKDKTILAFAGQTADASKRKGEFLAQITHEFRTPLNAIIGFSNQIDTRKLDTDLRLSIDSIKSASNIMLSLVNEILDFSKFESGKIVLQNEPFRPEILVRESLALLAVLADEKNIVISARYDLENKLTLSGDKFRIQQVVINLLTNAIKFTPEGGTVDVSLHFENQGQGKGMMRIGIRDSGVGIAKEHLDSVFEDFIQVPSTNMQVRQSSTGLGLAICKRIVDLYQGKLNVESSLGKGSNFTVDIPLEIAANAEDVPVLQEKNRNSETNLKSKRLLVADDNKMNLILISRIMDKMSATYDLADNGQSALDMFEKNAYDLVITDISMPVMDGVELTKRIRSHAHLGKARIPVIGFTGYTDKEKLDYYREIGMDEILPKPFDETHFKAIITGLLADRL
ncbi:ATP-binding protein [Dyadobacter sp. LJ419]|uniref:histidine kinase n=1 Tax=Dyadobacter chenwenxiniae TaxID=2906456 RepID=A0A9X1PK96_9BACT|nr:ATP-binding protein [Dyadobacter chenwenxiniae]MCF0062625.1 ATP-binding protein [Dyadobacter chenwenxiniae]